MICNIYMLHLNVKQKLEFYISVAVIYTKRGAKKQTVSDIRKTKSDHQKYSGSFNIGGISHYIKGDPSKHIKPANQV